MIALHRSCSSATAKVTSTAERLRRGASPAPPCGPSTRESAHGPRYHSVTMSPASRPFALTALVVLAGCGGSANTPLDARALDGGSRDAATVDHPGLDVRDACALGARCESDMLIECASDGAEV